MLRIARDCDKVIKVIESCNTTEQLNTASNMAFAFSYTYDLGQEENIEYADSINETLDWKEEELWQSKKIGFILE